MSEQPVDVSVIVITYNHRLYIRQALESILMQKTRYRYEVLIGDDASTDGTSDIVREYAQKYPEIVRAFVRETNMGSVRNAYETLKAARGRYLATCEGDDFWTDPDKLETQIDFMEKHPQYVGCVHKVGLVDQDGRRIAGKRLDWMSDKDTFSLKDYKGVVLPGHAVSQIRRNLFLDPTFDSEFMLRANRYIADRTLALLWLSRGDFYRLDKEMACYRYVERGSNLTSVMYKTSHRRFSDDYEYTLTLEKYAQDILHVDGGFRYHKRSLFVKSLVFAVLHPGQGHFNLVKRMLKESDRPLWYVAGIVPVALGRFRTYMQGRILRRFGR